MTNPVPSRLVGSIPLLFLSVVGCAGSNPAATDDVEPVGTSAEAVTAAATLLVAGDFAATSSTKGIVQNEIASNGAVKLLAVGDMSYSAPYSSNYPWASWAARTFPVMGNHEFNSVAGTGGQQPFDLFNGTNAAGNLKFPAITGANGVDTYDFSYSHEITPGWLLAVVNTGVNCAQQSCATQAARLKTAITSWRNGNGGHGCVIVAMHTARWSTMFSSDADNEPWAAGVAPIWSSGDRRGGGHRAARPRARVRGVREARRQR